MPLLPLVLTLSELYALHLRCFASNKICILQASIVVLSMEYFYTSINEFASFSLEHLFVILAYSLFAIGTFVFANKYLNEQGKYRLGFALALIPMLMVILRMYVIYRMGDFSYMKDLPLFICRLVSFILPIMLIKKSKSLFGILYFWVMAGTSNAVITPDIKFGLPHYESIFYWLIHIGLIVSILYCVFVFKWRPSRKDIWRAFWWANGYLILIHLINLFLGTNYSYTMFKPVNGSILDFFGPWPIYLLTGQFLALVLFALFYLPFLKNKKVK